MFLHEIFQPEFIKFEMGAGDKNKAFEELVDHLCNTEKIKARDEILAALREREAKMSTGIYKGIAVPHGKTAAVDKICGVLGVSKKGVEYDALDGEPVYLFFMIIAPQEDSEKHLRILKRLSQLLENPQFHLDLQSQKNSQGMFNVICKYEEVLLSENSE